MSSHAERQFANVTPPRRGACIALAVDSTARPYDISNLDIGGWVQDGKSADQRVYVTLQASGGDVWFYFASATASDLDDTSKIAAGSALAYANTYGDKLPQGATIALRLSRKTDKFLICKTSTGTAVLLLRASSDSWGE